MTGLLSLKTWKSSQSHLKNHLWIWNSCVWKWGTAYEYLPHSYGYLKRENSCPVVCGFLPKTQEKRLVLYCDFAMLSYISTILGTFWCTKNCRKNTIWRTKKTQKKHNDMLHEKRQKRARIGARRNAHDLVHEEINKTCHGCCMSKYKKRKVFLVQKMVL